MSERTLVQSLAAFVEAHPAGHVPSEVAGSVRQRILDILGLCAAAAPLEVARGVVDYVATQGGAPQAHATGVKDAVPAAQAAFVNGVLAHALDYDDTHLPSVLHPSASVVPAALAVAERTGADGRALTAAVAVGLEVCVRLGMAGYDREARTSTFFEHGQHATSICGAIGSAAAAAQLLGLDAEGVASAMGIAVSMAGGVIEANRTGGTVKRIHCGWAAHSGVAAAELARVGVTGPPTVLEGRFGFFEAFLRGRYDPEELTRDLGERWLVPGIFFKPYPANHFTHAAIDAAAALRARGVDPDDLTNAHLGVAGATVRTIGEPIEVKRRPETGYQAQFSGPYAVVAGLLGGEGLGVGLEDFTDELARDPRRRELMAKVVVAADPRCDEIFPQQFPAVLHVRTRGGEELVEEVLVNRGGPDRPLSDEELARKFRDNAARTLEGPTVEALVQRVHHLDELERVGDLTHPLATVQLPDLKRPAPRS